MVKSVIDARVLATWECPTQFRQTFGQPLLWLPWGVVPTTNLVDWRCVERSQPAKEHSRQHRRLLVLPVDSGADGEL